MWRRIKRLLENLLGKWLEKRENPRDILLQNIQELNDQVRYLNENIATVKANLTLRQREKRQLEIKLRKLKDKIVNEINANRRNNARSLAMEYHKLKELLKANEIHLEIARKAYDKSLSIKKMFVEEKNRKTKDALKAIREAERAQWQRNIANALENAESYSIDQTHDEMISKIEYQSDYDDARLQVLLDQSKQTDSNDFNRRDSAAEYILNSIENELAQNGNIESNQQAESENKD